MTSAQAGSTESDFSVRFSMFCGEMAESMSFNRSVGQIYGLLYMESRPASLSEIAKRLSMSKGNASINLRALETWGAVHRTVMPGSRQDHYEADRDIKALVMRRAKDGLTKRLDLAEKHLKRWESVLDPAAGRESGAAKKRIQDLKQLISKGRKAVQFLPRLAGFL